MFEEYFNFSLSNQVFPKSYTRLKKKEGGGGEEEAFPKFCQQPPSPPSPIQGKKTPKKNQNKKTPNKQKNKQTNKQNQQVKCRYMTVTGLFATWVDTGVNWLGAGCQWDELSAIFSEIDRIWWLSHKYIITSNSFQKSLHDKTKLINGSMYLSSRLSYKRGILIFAAGRKFINGTCEFQSFPRSSAWHCMYVGQSLVYIMATVSLKSLICT